MFDWNDEEFANIVWGEAGESDDHIVPYQEASEDLHDNDKKEWNEETSATKLIEQKRIEAKTDFCERKLGSCSKLGIIKGQSSSEYGANSLPDLCLSSAAKTDQGSLGTEVSKNLEETTQLEKDVEIFRSTQEGKDQGDFVDYSWANIGSFDDLDQIFSNEEPIFSHVSLENSEEPWSSKNVSNNSTVSTLLEVPSPARALRHRSDPLESKAEYVQHNDQSFSLSFKRIGHSSSHNIQNAHANTGNVGYARDRVIPTDKEQQDMVGRTASLTSALAAENVVTANGLTDEDFGPRNQLKAQENSLGKQEGKVLQEFYGTWSPSTRQFQNQLAPSVIQSSPSSILGQQKQLQGPGTLYQDMTNTYVTFPAFGNLPNAYPSMSMLSQAQSGVLMRQPMLSGEASLDIRNPVKKSVETVMPLNLTMTPQEKIEKLRRRQQMQAMLAIQKQQQELGHQAPSTNKSMTQTCAIEMQSQLDGADPETDDLKSLPALDPPTEQDDSNTISSAINDHFVEDTILYMLQDAISKLDIKVRLCIRDSLFRLAQSAMQRNYTSDTSSTNNSSREELKVIGREDRKSQNGYAKVADVETQTNPIDRIVAHLLFHRPLDLTRNYSEKLDSPVSAKMQCDSKAANLENFPTVCLPDEDLKSNQQFSQGPQTSSSLLETQPEDHFKDNHCIDTSENASNSELADVGEQEHEASR